MKEFINKNVGLIKICSVVLFVALMAFNVVVTQNTHGNTNVDLSLSGLKAMALGSGEGGGGCQDSGSCCHQFDANCYICGKKKESNAYFQDSGPCDSN